MPQPVERLEKTLARVAKDQGVAQERLRRWVSFLALCGVLERAVSESILDSYDVKGGVALELRFAKGARATKDIDIGVPVERTKRLRAFQDAIALGFDDFTFLVKGKPLKVGREESTSGGGTGVQRTRYPCLSADRSNRSGVEAGASSAGEEAWLFNDFGHGD